MVWISTAGTPSLPVCPESSPGIGGEEGKHAAVPPGLLPLRIAEDLVRTNYRLPFDSGQYFLGWAVREGALDIENVRAD